MFTFSCPILVTQTTLNFPMVLQKGDSKYFLVVSRAGCFHAHPLNIKIWLSMIELLKLKLLDFIGLKLNKKVYALNTYNIKGYVTQHFSDRSVR